LIGPVAWQSVQGSASPCNSPSPRRELRGSPCRGGSSAHRRRSPLEDRRSVIGSSDGWPLRIQNLSPNRSNGRHKESPRQCRPRPRAASHDLGKIPLAGGDSGRPGAGTPQLVNLRDSAGARTPALLHPGSESGRNSSAVRLRRDREGCQRAIAAQFQNSDEAQPGSSPKNKSHMHALEFYAIGRLLGKGAFGKVNVGVHKLTEELTAIKLCERKRIAEVQAKKCLMQEVSILKRLNGHPNIIRLFEVIETAAQVVLVMEFASGGDLLRYVRQRRWLAESCAQDLFKQLLDGIAHIHSMGVIHRDIKLENLLLDAFSCLKIADFGVAVIVKSPGKKLNEHCGTPSYIAPEILLESGYDGQPVDVWSAGVVLYAMLCGRVPFKGENLADLKRCILRGKFHVPSNLSKKADLMIRGVIVVDPKKRFTIRDALEHQWLHGVVNRAATVYGVPEPVCSQDGGMSEGVRPLPNDRVTKDLLGRVAMFGFPRTHIEESLRDGRLNHATATFYLLAQQGVCKRTMASPCSIQEVQRDEPESPCEAEYEKS